MIFESVKLRQIEKNDLLRFALARGLFRLLRRFAGAFFTEVSFCFSARGLRSFLEASSVFSGAGGLFGLINLWGPAPVSGFLFRHKLIDFVGWNNHVAGGGNVFAADV